MNTTKKLAYSLLASTLIVQNNAMALEFGGGKVNDRLKGANDTADSVVQTLISNALWFLAIIAVIYGLYGGFLMLTAGWDDGKVKKWKEILIQVGLGLVVIFLANSIVQFVLSKILGGNQ